MADVPVLTASEVRRLCGDLPDTTVEAIVSTGADLADLEAAVFCDPANGGAGVVSGAVAEIRRIIEEDADWDDEPA